MLTGYKASSLQINVLRPDHNVKRGPHEIGF